MSVFCNIDNMKDIFHALCAWQVYKETIMDS